MQRGERAARRERRKETGKPEREVGARQRLLRLLLIEDTPTVTIFRWLYLSKNTFPFQSR